MVVKGKNHSGRIKSPMNYIGGKYRLFPQIFPLFPSEIDKFVDLFCGGCDVGINIGANKIIFNDNLIFLIEMYKLFQKNSLYETILYVEKRIKKFNLSLTNGIGYKKLRDEYNTWKNPLDLFILITFSFNHQIRFNSNHEFNNPFGKKRSYFNSTIKEHLINFITKLKESDIEFSCKCFTEFDFSFLTDNDFVYCDPPYLIAKGTYNDGKRGFKGWTEKEEKSLLNTLDELDKKNIKFALSNVLEHKYKTNNILKIWLENNLNYRINFLNYHYSNSNYHRTVKNKNTSIEVLITNYIPIISK